MELSNDCSQKDCEVSSSVHCLWLASTSGETLDFRVTAVHGVGGLWSQVAAPGPWISLPPAGRPGW